MSLTRPELLPGHVRPCRYGKQYVPISEVDDMFYAPGKTLQLLGFVDLQPLQTDQRYLLLGDPSVSDAGHGAGLREGGHILIRCSFMSWLS